MRLITRHHAKNNNKISKRVLNSGEYYYQNILENEIQLLFLFFKALNYF